MKMRQGRLLGIYLQATNAKINVLQVLVAHGGRHLDGSSSSILVGSKGGLIAKPDESRGGRCGSYQASQEASTTREGGLGGVVGYLVGRQALDGRERREKGGYAEDGDTHLVVGEKAEGNRQRKQQYSVSKGSKKHDTTTSRQKKSAEEPKKLSSSLASAACRHQRRKGCEAEAS